MTTLGEKCTSLPCVISVFQSEEPVEESGKVKGDMPLMHAFLKLEPNDKSYNSLIILAPMEEHHPKVVQKWSDLFLGKIALGGMFARRFCEPRG